MELNKTIQEKVVSNFDERFISQERKEVLQFYIDYLQFKKKAGEQINLNFICTHNSRRSQFSQVWAKVFAYYFKVKNVNCYSGGTEVTEVYPSVIESLENQGFEVLKLSKGENPVYALKFEQNQLPIILYSKKYSNNFNPKSNFCAIVTCSSADENCPLVLGAEHRIAIRYNDPKEFDNSSIELQKYLEKSLEIAQEMWFVFKEVSKNHLKLKTL